MKSIAVEKRVPVGWLIRMLLMTTFYAFSIWLCALVFAQLALLMHWPMLDGALSFVPPRFLPNALGFMLTSFLLGRRWDRPLSLFTSFLFRVHATGRTEYARLLFDCATPMDQIHSLNRVQFIIWRCFELVWCLATSIHVRRRSIGLVARLPRRRWPGLDCTGLCSRIGCDLCVFDGVGGIRGLGTVCVGGVYGRRFGSGESLLAELVGFVGVLCDGSGGCHESGFECGIGE